MAYIPENIKYLDKGFNLFLMNGHSRRAAFDDWLDMMICSFGMQKYEKTYLEIVGKYKKDELEKFAEMFGWLIKHLEENQFTDPLGDYFQYCITRGEHGQYFTPSHVSNMMAEIVSPLGQETVIDSSCGSGRMLLAAIEVARKTGYDPYCFGADLDKTCVKMCAINLFLYGVDGEVACMNSISNDFFFAYKLTNPFQGGLTIIDKKEDSIIWKMGNKRFEKPIQEPELVKTEMVKMFQESLF